jgi:Glycosyltransferase family 87
MLRAVRNVRVAIVTLFRRYPWIGWVAWGIFVAAALARTHPRRFASTFAAYLDAAQRLWAGQQVYDPTTLGDFLYFPLTLLIYVPFTLLDRVTAAALAMLLGAAFFTWACTMLTVVLLQRDRRLIDLIALAGVPLLINIPAAWLNFKGVQAQVPMTAAMMAACVAMIDARWRMASFWLFVAIAMKPLAIVMVLLCGALVREMRLPLVGAVAAAILVPFAFLEWSYLAAQYQAMALKLWHITTAPPAQWIYQADFSTMMRGLGVPPPAGVALGIRIAAALGTLALAWRVNRDGGSRSFALAVLVLSGCYITLFGPRNEFLSFIVLTPSLAVLAGLMLMRNDADARGWLLVIAALLLGFTFDYLAVDGVLKPAIVLAIYLWLTWQMAVPARWREIVEGDERLRAGAGELVWRI